MERGHSSQSVSIHLLSAQHHALRLDTHFLSFGAGFYLLHARMVMEFGFSFLLALVIPERFRASYF